MAYRDADKSLARPTSRCILFDGENISFDASLVVYTEGAKKCIHILRYVICLLLFEVELNYGSNV